MCSIDETGRLVDTYINRKKGGEKPTRCIQQNFLTQKLLAELLWVAHLHCGDYHNNMNLESFMKKAKEGLVPIFEPFYLGKEMIKHPKYDG